MTKRSFAMGVLLLVGVFASQATMNAQERVVLDRPTASSFEGLSSINGLRELSDGRVLVSDRLGKVVLRLDLESGTIDTLGRQGQGPGEYEMPGALYALADDWTLLMDMANMRLTWIAPDGVFGESVSVRQGEMFIIPRGVDAQGHVYFDQSGALSFRSGEDLSERSNQAPILRWDPEADAFDTLATITGPDVSGMSQIRIAGGGSFNMAGGGAPAPYRWVDSWGVGSDGSVHIARARPFRIEQVAGDHTETGPEIRYRPVKVTRADKEAWADAQASRRMVMSIAGQGSRTIQRERPDIDAIDWPDEKPAFPRNAVDVTPFGEVWVERYVRAGAPTEYSAFSRSGELARTIVLPEGTTLAGFGQHAVYLSRADEFDLQWLERYIP